MTGVRAGNPIVAAAGWPPAVIAGAFQTGVLGVRSLARRGVRAICFDGNRLNPGFRSVHGPARLCPDPGAEPAGWLEFMVALGREFRTKPALIASSDQFVSAIAVHESELGKYFILSPGAATQGLLADKQTQYDLAARHGMPMPKTARVCSTDEVVDFARHAMFPCLLKPTHFREWTRFPAGHPLLYKKIAIARSPDELVKHYQLASAVNAICILQEIIAGPDTAKRVYLSCYDGNSRRIARAMFRELRCDPLGFGPASVSEPVVDDVTDGICDDFLRGIGYHGICEIEMKWDSRDGQVKLIEANPRLSGGGDAAPYVGVDLCWLHYLDLIGQSVTPVQPTTNDLRHIVLRADGSAIPAYRRAGLLSWREALQSYRSPRAFYDLDAADWRYSMETLLIAGKAFVLGMLAPQRGDA